MYYLVVSEDRFHLPLSGTMRCVSVTVEEFGPSVTDCQLGSICVLLLVLDVDFVDGVRIGAPHRACQWASCVLDPIIWCEDLIKFGRNCRVEVVGT